MRKELADIMVSVLDNAVKEMHEWLKEQLEDMEPDEIIEFNIQDARLILALTAAYLKEEVNV